MVETSFADTSYRVGHTIGYYKGLFIGLIIGTVVTAGVLYYMNDFPGMQPTSTNPFTKINLQTKLEQK